MKKYYFGKTQKEIEELENRYNFIPVETSNNAAKKSLNNICVTTVKDIANTKEKNLPTDDLEKSLFKYREYAIKKNID